MVIARLWNGFLRLALQGSIEVATAQEEPARFADHFAPGIAHLGAAIWAIGGNVSFLLCRELIGRNQLDAIFFCHGFSGSLTLSARSGIGKSARQQLWPR